MRVLRLILLYMLFVLNADIIYSQETSATLSGFVYDKSTGETLIGANVFFKDLGTGTSTNVYG
ncbi:MAG: hypothetical protein CVV23_08095, partial [Ignavibacteriae bacterium HGW-Ignavibacteriae-2]